MHSFLSATVEEMRAAIQQKALKDLNEWLVRLGLSMGLRFK